MNKKNEEIQKKFVDAIVEAPIEFNLEGKYFCIYPKCFGVNALVNNIRRHLDISEENVQINPILECLRICQEKRSLVLRLITLCTCKGQKQITNAAFIEKRMKFFDEHMEESDMANLLLHCLQDDSEKLATFMEELGINEQLKKKKAIIEAKSKNQCNQVSYGGVTLMGSIIGWFSERFGWTADYIIYGISYVNLMMMYYDHFESVYLTEEEVKRLPVKMRLPKEEIIDGNDYNAIMKAVKESEENPL
jgi:hypothetical protein|nr:MAG TPA_asm: hypothetical protein [Caudoviricetes sp.]